MAIENGNRVVMHGRAFNTNDDQFIHTGPLGYDNIRVSIVDPVDMDVFLPIPCDEIRTISDAISGFVS